MREISDLPKQLQNSSHNIGMPLKKDCVGEADKNQIKDHFSPLGHCEIAYNSDTHDLPT